MDKKEKKMEQFNYDNEDIMLENTMTICSWCKASGLSDEKSAIPFSQIGGIDKNTGSIVCKKCIDKILQSEITVQLNMNTANVA